MPIVDSALKYINRGLSIIPLKKDSKVPLLPEWKLYQSRTPNEEEVLTWYRRWPDAGVGIICGTVSGKLAVLDIDDLELAEKIAALGEQLPTLTTRTPSMGLHLLVRETASTSRSGPLVPGVADLKAEGGYIVVPPTTHYKPLNKKEILVVPDAREWALGFLKSFGVEPQPTNGNGKAYETLIERDLADGERNVTLASYAGKMWREGWDADRILIMLDAVNLKSCKPPLPDEDVKRIVSSITSLYPKGELQILEDPKGLLPVYPGDMPRPKPREFVIEGLVPKDYVTLLYGDGGQGKSFLAVGLAISVATGETILMRGIRQTNVLYLDWELDQDEFIGRAYRIALGMGFPRPPKETLIYMRLEKPLSMILPAIKAFIDEHRIGLVVIDSLGMAGVRDINSTEGIIEFFEKLRSLKTTFLALDHQPKLKPDQAYGMQTAIGSVYKGNLSRSVIQLQKTGWRPGQLDLKLEHKKINFGSLVKPITFSMLFEQDKITFLPYVILSDGLHATKS